MAFENFRKSCICLSAFFISVSLVPCSFAETGKVQNTSPTQPVTTTTINNPGAVSTKSHIIEKQASININDHVVMVSGHVSAGLVNGKAQELVWDSGYKLSELDWQINNVFMVGAGVSVKPLSWLRINGNIWFQVDNGDGTMDDYDWLVYRDTWSDWSHHTDVTVKDGKIYDINAEFTVLRYNESSLFAIVGYKHDNWKWVARGGTYIYSQYGFRDTSGSFPDGELGITYEQTFDTPYIGFGFHANLAPVTLTGRFIGSAWVSSDDKDTHHMRNIYFTDDFSSGKMYAIDFACTYNFTDHLAATAGFQYQKFEETTGDAHALDLTTGEYYTWPDGAGISNETTMINISLMYTL